MVCPQLSTLVEYVLKPDIVAHTQNGLHLNSKSPGQIYLWNSFRKFTFQIDKFWITILECFLHLWKTLKTIVITINRQPGIIHKTYNSDSVHQSKFIINNHCIYLFIFYKNHSILESQIYDINRAPDVHLYNKFNWTKTGEKNTLFQWIKISHYNKIDLLKINQIPNNYFIGMFKNKLFA